jgi:hypothetical protein
MPDWWATSDALRDLLVAAGKAPAPQRSFALEEILPGWLVYDSEREPVGRVDGLMDRYLVVRRRFWGFLTWRRIYVPETGLGEAHEGSVILNVPRSWIGTMGWGRPPRRPPPRPTTPTPRGSGRTSHRPHFSRHRA